GATVRAIGPLDGDLVAFGAFTAVGGAPISGVARWSGGAWQAMTSVTAAAATLDEFGKVWVAGPGAAYGAPEVFTWTGSAWLGFGTSIGEIQAIAVANNQPVIGRDSYYGYGPSIARWNGAQWATFGQGLDGPVDAVLVRSNGDVIAGGEFLFSGSTQLSRIARWDGTAWQPFGPGLDGPVRALAELPDGELLAAGDFVNDGTMVRPLNLIARWDGTNWQLLGLGLGGRPGASVRALS